MALPTLNSSKYKTTIPSTGKSIEYRPYLVKEEKILMIALESQEQQQILSAIKGVIESCVTQDINAENLTMFDIESIFLALRSKSVGERVELQGSCSKCDQKVQLDLMLEDVKCEGVDVEKVLQLSEEVGVKMKFPSVSTMEKFKEGELESVDGILKLISLCIDSIFDENNVYPASEESEENLLAFLESLSSNQLKTITNFFDSMPVLSHNIEFSCVCGEDNKIELRGLQSFFM